MQSFAETNLKISMPFSQKDEIRKRVLQRTGNTEKTLTPFKPAV